MADLVEWLARNKLANLEGILVDNEIDLDILFDLTDADMREIGLSLGARKRLQAAIEAGEPGPPQPAVSGSTVGRRDAERRHLTTLFVDLVGSTALSTRFDPEEMSEVIKRYQNTVAGIVTRYEGHVAKYMGDGVLCYFGWPVAHEDDAERAVRSGLAITRSITELRSPDGQELSARAGVATGMVVVGDLIGEGAAQEETVVGDTPNLAARLQAFAKPGQVLVPDSTKQLIQDTFELEQIGSFDVKGFETSVPAWRVAAERSLEGRFEAKDVKPVLPMIGRDHELGLIMERWQRAISGEGQIIVLIGEAGIGKSRLTRAVIDAVSTLDHFRINYHCSPYHTDSSFYPVIQQLSHAVGFLETDSANQKIGKLREQLRIADPRIIAELLQIETDPSAERSDMSPQQLRLRIMEETSAEVQALSREKPVLLVVEDAHWIDASTLAMIEACLDRIVAERVMILITGRPDFQHTFGGHPIVSKLTLNRLGSEQTESVLAKKSGGKSLPSELVAEIIHRTDGVPLFIEELTKTILESGDLKETKNGFQLVGPIDRVTIPATLHDSLMARIDRLQPMKEIAQMAACIGRSFDRASLAKIARVDDLQLDEALGQLERSELVFRRGMSPDATYVFKHALVRDVAYESLLKRRRLEIHRRLTDLFEADPKAPEELVAHHAAEAGLTERAVLLWGEAAKKAQARPAYVEAGNHLRNALTLVSCLMDKPEWRERELALLVQLAQVHIAKDGYASAEASDAFSQALERIEATTDPELKVAIYYGTWIAPYIGNDQHSAFDLVSRLVEDLANEPDPVPRLISRRMRAATLIAKGRSAEALEDLNTAYALYQSAEIVDFSTKFAQDPGVQIWCYMFLAQWMCGDEDKAREIANKALARARELKHANTICYVGLHDVTLSIWIGDVKRASEINEEMRRVSEEHDMSLWKDFVAIHDAVLACMTDEPGAVDRLDAALEEYRAKGCWLWVTLHLAEHAKAQLRAGDFDAAQKTVDRAYREQDNTGERWAEAELHRIEGEIRAAVGKTDAANTFFDQAVSVAQVQKAYVLAERALKSKRANNSTTG
ncbi:ATP-binding protein [Ruegeria lacuscaerulensis]|uniref:ATP-binding protein n=1 Tax=Ruegeria lacuscaerulensis TaxID=55218 RepID=UPI00147FE663|nr:adenylate/guanylate cyclase domain-containing protein [Ruegeria lacuscaerulensis]